MAILCPRSRRSLDAFPFGERRYLAPEDVSAGWHREKLSMEEVRRLNAKCRAKESTIVKTLAYAGLTWPRVAAWDDMRTVDYLCTRPEADPKRIGCVGVSFGGWRSLFPPEGMQAAVDRLHAIYEKAGASNLFAAHFYDGPQRFDVPMQEDAFAWLDRWLKPEFR